MPRNGRETRMWASTVWLLLRRECALDLSPYIRQLYNIPEMSFSFGTLEQLDQYLELAVVHPARNPGFGQAVNLSPRH